MKLHWQVLIALLAGLALGGYFQFAVEGAAWLGARFEDGSQGGVRLIALTPGGPAADARLSVGATVTAVTRFRDTPNETTSTVRNLESYEAALAEIDVGEAVWLHGRDGTDAVPVIMALDPESPRALGLRPFSFIADIFMALLKMLIVPIILTSIITGVTGVGSGRDLRRMGLKTFAYYAFTSLMAAMVGLVLVNVVRPGEGAALGLRPSTSFEEVAKQSFWDVLRRAVPENVFAAFSDNGQMLSVIFFALMFGYFILRTEEPHQSRMRGFFESAFAVIMKLAGFVLSLIPYGVFALLVKVVGRTGFGLFESLGLYMAVVAGGLLVHSLLTLPVLLRFVGRISPFQWSKAMAPALLTAFSTSSSSMTLPVSLETTEHRGKVSNRVTSFVLPLGATINMDGTALYECAGVIFLAQYYAGISDFTLTLGDQVLVVVMALLASVGAAGIPSAGLVMMLTILSALRLPVEGAALLLAVDRPLDMLRTAVNVWSDSCGAAIVAKSEGETPLVEAPEG